MSDLIELVLNCLLELVLNTVEAWASWRFFVPFLGSIGVLVALAFHGASSECSLRTTLILAAGVIAGILWEIMDRRLR
jgi:hypothetical protein